MMLDWKFFLDKQLKDILGDASWPPTSQDVLDKAHEQVAAWLAGDNAAIKKAITDALSDNKLTEKELTGILTLVAQGWANDKFLGNDFVLRLLASLSDGTLSAGEIADVAAELVTRKISNDTLKQLIKSVSDGHLSRDEVESALLDWVKRNGPAGLDAKLKTVLDSPDPVNLRSVIMLAVSFLITEGKITNPISSIDKQIKGVVDALQNYAGADMVKLIQALVDKDYLAAAKTVLAKLGVTIEDAVIQQILDGKFADVAQGFLKGALEREITDITDEQAAGLADAIIKIISGKMELIPAKNEQGALQLDDWQYGIWIEVRKVLYAVKMAIGGGPIVPSDAMAQPHVFAAAAIGFGTPVKSLAPEARWQELLDMLQAFTYIEFKAKPGGAQYKVERPIYMDMLKAGKTAEFIFDDVCGKLLLG